MPQAVHDQLDRARVEHVQTVAGPGEVDVVPLVLGGQPVERLVVDAAERERRAELVPLGGVVVDHVEDHLDACTVQGLDHRLELVDLLSDRARRVGVVRGEEPDRVVSPVVRQPLLDEMAVVHELMHRHQLDRRHAEGQEVLHDRVVREGEVRAADLRRDRRVVLRHPLHVGLVDHGPVPRGLRSPVLAPGERRVDHHALRHRARAVAPVDGEVLVLVADLVAVHGVVPPDRAADGPRVRIEEELVRVEPMPVSRLVRPVHPVAVQASRPHVRQVGVPQEVGPVRERDAFGLDRVVRPVVQTEVDARRVLGEQGEVDPFAVPRGALWIRRARPDADRHEARDPSSRSVTGRKKRHVSGGSTISALCGRSCHGVGSASTRPRFPAPDPP